MGTRGAPPDPRRSRVWILVVAFAVIVLAGVGAVVYVAGQDDSRSQIVSSDGSAVTSAGAEDDPPVSSDPEPGDDGGNGADTADGGDGAEESGGTVEGDGADESNEAVGSAVAFSDEMLDAAIAAGVAAPLDGLPSDDDVATAVLTGELEAAGFDLTGLGVRVYPASTAPSFVLLETDDSTALILEDDGGENFVLAILDSPIIGDRGIEQLILRHSGSDEEGPFVLSFIVPLPELRSAADGTADISEFVSVQVERT